MSSRPPVSREELERIERFIAAFNALEDWFRSQPDAPPTFRSSVDWWAARHPFWRDAETLRLFASLRNFLVHEKTRPFDYPCVPSQSAVEEIEDVRQRLFHPALIGEQFRREVVILRPSDTLETALATMKSRDIARFPVFENDRFVGVLGERDIARFLSECVAAKRVFAPQTPVSQALPGKIKRQTFAFAPPEMSVSEAAFWFGENTFLEAILIAPREGARPTGIVTRGDVAGWNE